jgi:two-component system OmpR family response regulator
MEWPQNGVKASKMICKDCENMADNPVTEAQHWTSQRKTMPHILLIDDDAELSGMLTEYLAGEGFETTAALNGEEGAAAAVSGRYDAVVLDIMLPGINGIEVLRRVRQTSVIPIIMLTAKGDDIDRVVGLEMGADDYVAKPYYPRELVARLRAVLRRQSGSERQVDTGLAVGGLTLHPGRREVQWSGMPFELTASEFNMLEALARGGDVVTTKEDLSVSALGRAWEPYDRSVDVHVSNLRKKLAAISNGKLEIETIRGIGYRVRQRP